MSSATMCMLCPPAADGESRACRRPAATVCQALLSPPTTRRLPPSEHHRASSTVVCVCVCVPANPGHRPCLAAGSARPPPPPTPPQPRARAHIHQSRTHARARASELCAHPSMARARARARASPEGWLLRRRGRMDGRRQDERGVHHLLLLHHLPQTGDRTARGAVRTAKLPVHPIVHERCVVDMQPHQRAQAVDGFVPLDLSAPPPARVAI